MEHENDLELNYIRELCSSPRDDISQLQYQRSLSAISQINFPNELRHLPSILELSDVLRLMNPRECGSNTEIKEQQETMKTPENKSEKSQLTSLKSTSLNTLPSSKCDPLSPLNSKNLVAARFMTANQNFSKLSSSSVMRGSDIQKIEKIKKNRDEVKDLLKYCEEHNTKPKEARPKVEGLFQTFKLKDLRKYLESRSG